MKQIIKISIIMAILGIAMTGCKKDKDPVITITAQPQATTTVTAGSITGSLTVTATATEGATPSYQWYSNTTASNTGGTAETGATGASFTIPPSLAAGTYYYFCEVSAKGAKSVRSNAATVTVQPAPAKTVSVGAQVGTLTAGKAGTVTYEVTTANIPNGDYDPTVANRPDGVTIQGKVTIAANKGTLTLAGSNATTAAVTSTLTLMLDGVTSAAFAIEIEAPASVITITTDPISANVTFGSISGSLIAAATATESATVSFEWFSNDTESNEGGTTTGATGATFTIPTTLTAAGSPYYYFCEVSAAGADPKRTAVATVTVAKADGASLQTAPQAKTVTQNSIEINVITTASQTNQTVEYAISKTQQLPTDPDDWQPETIFEELEAATLYYVWARAKENDNYNVGGVSYNAIWTDGDGSSGMSITMETAKSGEVNTIWLTGSNITINWGDGSSPETFETSTGEQFFHTYSDAVKRTITITGDNISLLYCFYMELTDLKISACPGLIELWAHGNELTNLDLSANTMLERLRCEDNQLQSLNVSANINLKSLNCSYNLLESLDVSANTNLEGFDLGYNLMEAPALNAIFNALPKYTVPETGWIRIEGNPGEDDCNTSLLPAGWSLYVDD